MSKVKSALVYVAGITVAVLTLQVLRKRRSSAGHSEHEETTGHEIHDDPETPAEHAAAAVEHARVAAAQTVDAAREQQLL